MDNSWQLRDRPGRCLYCGQPLKMNDGSGYCSYLCEQKDLSVEERAKTAEKENEDA